MAGAEPDVYVDVATELLAVAAQCLADHTPVVGDERDPAGAEPAEPVGLGIERRLVQGR